MEEGNAVDLSNFWSDDAYSQSYRDVELTDEMIAIVEERLGYKLPQIYKDLCKIRNGGVPIKTEFQDPNSSTTFSIHTILAIGIQYEGALCGQYGNDFLIEEWGYPTIGVYFADTPSAGHDMFCLDYRACGPRGEPSVIVVDQEDNYRVIPIANTMAEFVANLKVADEGDESQSSGCFVS